MTPTIEEQPVRHYCIRFSNGDTAEVVAETVCEPSKDEPFFVFKRDGIPVAKYRAEVVGGWHVEGR